MYLVSDFPIICGVELFEWQWEEKQGSLLMPEDGMQS
jgi:hypothetical protein